MMNELNDLDLVKLEALLKLCNKQHVYAVKLGDLTLNIQPTEGGESIGKPFSVMIDEDTGMVMTPEEVQYYKKQMREGL